MVLDPDTSRTAHGPWYSEERWERFAPLAGIVAVILWIIGVAVLEGAADTPDDNAPAAEWSAYYDEGSGGIVAGAFLFMLGVAAFVWYLGSLRARLFALEGPAARLTAVVFAAGVLIAAMSMAFVAPEAAAAFASGELEVALEPAAAQALGVVGDGFFIAGEAATVVFFLAVGLAILRTRAFPRWLGYVSLVLGIAAALPWIGWGVYIWGVPLWVLVTSIWMFMRRDAGSPRPAEPDATTVRTTPAA